MATRERPSRSIPADVKTGEHHATAGDGAQIKMRWYVKAGATSGSAVLGELRQEETAT
ncbi:hypothetical protein [Streptomyces sp. NPDC058683]|uniref:hypothetical protein n=1 Tax=Streptomyces sp. NPDC058683 TaxID=3346597 RepID=UPI003651D223